MTRGLIKLSAIANNIEARRDWKIIEARLQAAGRQDMIDAYRPAPDAGWRKIDRAIDKVIHAMGWPRLVELKREASSENESC